MTVTVVQLKPLESECDFHVSQDWFLQSISFTSEHVEHVLCLFDSTLSLLLSVSLSGQRE